MANLKFDLQTIYDWKEYNEPLEVTEWHIGGNNSLSADYVKDKIK